MLDAVLKRPALDRLVVTTRMHDTRDLLRRLLLFHPGPGERSYVCIAHQALSNVVVAVLQVLDAHKLMIWREVLRGIETLPNHVLEIRYQGRWNHIGASDFWTYQAVQLVEHIQLNDVVPRVVGDGDCLVHELRGRASGDATDTNCWPALS